MQFVQSSLKHWFPPGEQKEPPPFLLRRQAQLGPRPTAGCLYFCLESHSALRPAGLFPCGRLCPREERNAGSLRTGSHGWREEGSPGHRGAGRSSLPISSLGERAATGRRKEEPKQPGALLPEELHSSHGEMLSEGERESSHVAICLLQGGEPELQDRRSVRLWVCGTAPSWGHMR